MITRFVPPFRTARYRNGGEHSTSPRRLPCRAAKACLSTVTKLTCSPLFRRARETLNDFNELMVCSATGIAKLVDVMFVRESVQAHQLASALAPIQLQLGRPIGEQESPHFRWPQKLAQFRGRHINQEQHEYPEGDGAEALPRETRN